MKIVEKENIYSIINNLYRKKKIVKQCWKIRMTAFSYNEMFTVVHPRGLFVCIVYCSMYLGALHSPTLRPSSVVSWLLLLVINCEELWKIVENVGNWVCNQYQITLLWFTWPCNWDTIDGDKIRSRNGKKNYTTIIFLSALGEEENTVYRLRGKYSEKIKNPLQIAMI